MGHRHGLALLYLPLEQRDHAPVAAQHVAKAGGHELGLAIFLLGFFALQGEGLAFAVLLAFAFNMTMPLTLRLAHRCNPAYPGLMFGLAAGCLLPGAFYPGAVFIPASAMVVLQFLCLCLVGYILRRFGRMEEGGAP